MWHSLSLSLECLVYLLALLLSWFARNAVVVLVSRSHRRLSGGKQQEANSIHLKSKQKTTVISRRSFPDLSAFPHTLTTYLTLQIFRVFQDTLPMLDIVRRHLLLMSRVQKTNNGGERGGYFISYGYHERKEEDTLSMNWQKSFRSSSANAASKGRQWQKKAAVVSL